ncbi:MULTISPECIES: hypothetical protein [unclassified Flavobacterium]|uniref:hypothetical protein n=1 Tax=unclassified Flavobacterium TaxID=196869 RepID=UPI001042D8D8|nr:MULTISPECIES: hypothetical protein [unclassified Flavobacterium]
MKMIALALIAVEILLLFSLKSKRLKRIAGLAPKKRFSFIIEIEMTKPLRFCSQSFKNMCLPPLVLHSRSFVLNLHSRDKQQNVGKYK